MQNQSSLLSSGGSLESQAAAAAGSMARMKGTIKSADRRSLTAYQETRQKKKKKKKQVVHGQSLPNLSK
jgi:hypothetical protein